MSFYPQIEGMSLPNLIDLFTCPPPGIPEDERELWLQEIAMKIGQSGDSGFSFLLDAIQKVDEDRQRAVLLGLSFVAANLISKKRREVKRILLPFLNSDNPMLIAEVIHCFRHLAYKNLLKHLLPFLDHPSPYVVGSVLHYFATWDPAIGKPLLIDALDSQEPIVRQVAIDQLEELECIEAIPHIRKLLQDSNRHVSLAAETALTNLSQL